MKGLSRRTSVGLVLCIGYAVTGCAAADTLLDATLTPPILTEGFERPVTLDNMTYKAGQTFKTTTNTWNVTASGIDIFSTAKPRADVAAYDGTQAVDMTASPGAGAIETTFSTIPKQQYTLTFHYARSNQIGNAAARMRAEVLGFLSLMQTEVTHDAESGSYNTYRRFSGNFTADGNQATLRFTSLTTGFHGITLDGISIRTVPASPPTPAGPLAPSAPTR